MAIKSARKTKDFSEAELQTMTEPVTVTLSRKVGGASTPLSLPPGEGHALSGQGYKLDDVRQLPKLILDSFGPGYYDVEVVGSDGRSLSYDVFFPVVGAQPPQPFMAQAAAPPPIPLPVAEHDPHYLLKMAASYPAGFPQQPYYQQQRPAYPPAWPTAPQAPIIDITAQREREKEREERIRAEERLRQQEQEHRHTLEMERLKVQVTRMQEQPVGATAASAELATLHREIAAQKEQTAQQAILTQMREMQTQNMSLIKDLQTNFQAQIAELRNQKPQGPDPMITVMLQTMAQQQTMFMSLMQQQNQNQLSPAQMLELVRQGSSSQEHIGKAYEQAWGLAANAMEASIAMQGPSVHPVAQAFVSMAEGAGVAVKEHFAIQRELIQMQAQQQQQQQQTHAAAPAQAPLAGAAEQPAGPTEAELAAQRAKVAESEKNIFGDAHAHVIRLRQEILADRVSPEEAAQAIVQAIEHYAAAAAAGVEMPKVFVLYRDGQFADFVDQVLSSTVPYAFREETATALVAKVSSVKGVRATA